MITTYSEELSTFNIMVKRRIVSDNEDVGGRLGMYYW